MSQRYEVGVFINPSARQEAKNLVSHIRGPVQGDITLKRADTAILFIALMN